jgi:hypothetical protein
MRLEYDLGNPRRSNEMGWRHQNKLPKRPWLWRSDIQAFLKKLQNAWNSCLGAERVQCYADGHDPKNNQRKRNWLERCATIQKSRSCTCVVGGDAGGDGRGRSGAQAGIAI